MSIASVEQLVGLVPPGGGPAAIAAPAAPRQELPGLRKAAVFLAQMSKEEAGVLLSKLRPREVEALTRELMRLGSVDLPDVDAVMTEFHSLMTAQHFIGRGGVDFAREILAAGLGEDKAGDILSRLNVVYTEVPFASLRNADTRQLVTFLKDEHPQIIALVLAHLTAGQSAEVLSGFAAEQQAEVAHRIAMMDRTSPEMVRLVEEELGRRMGSLLAHQDMTTVGGVETLVEIINRSPRPTERSILEWLDNTDPELAEQVRSQMFVFEDIVTIDDRSLQQVLREVEANDLATALKGVRPDVRDKVVRNLSERASENLTEEIELLGPVRTRTVEEAQAKIVGIIRTLEEQGILTLTRGQDDEFVS
jgi:flagellar motor switch protein FliG